MGDLERGVSSSVPVLAEMTNLHPTYENQLAIQRFQTSPQAKCQKRNESVARNSGIILDLMDDRD